MVYDNGSSANADMRLYRALSAGDLPAALLIKNPSEENPASLFNRGLCLFRLEEWEKSLFELKRAERLLGSPPEIDVSEREAFIKALSFSKGERTHLLPLDPENAADCARYCLIRVRWIEALCLDKLGRNGEAAAIKRFLAQYQIEL